MLKNRFGIIFGVANKRSIAWACAQALSEAGARLAFTYQGDRLKENVESLTRGMDGCLLLPCDVMKQDEVDRAFARVKEELEGEFVDTSRDGFLTALEVSSYSLGQLARAAAPLMTNGGSIVSMSYYGAEKVVQNYNVMGVAKAALESCTRYLAADLGARNIRVNAISAGPINTLSARGVANMNLMLKHHAERAPLQRNVDAREVGNAALFLCSPLASAITGEVLHVDCGYNIMAF